MSKPATGRCLCGDVNFKVTGPLRGVVACHCKQCQRQTGSYVMASGAKKADVSIDGVERLNWFRASPKAERGFCSRCGSLMFWRSDASDGISIMAGAFDDNVDLQGVGHIHCATKSDYYEIAEGLPQYETDDGGALVVYPTKID